jgi:hypothetical protein
MIFPLSFQSGINLPFWKNRTAPQKHERKGRIQLADSKSSNEVASRDVDKTPFLDKGNPAQSRVLPDTR